MLHAWHKRIEQQLEYDGSKIGQRNVCPNIKNMQNYVALLHDSRWVKGILHWTPRGGSSGRSSSYGKLQYKIFAAGITGATGLTLPETPISGSNTTPTSFPLSSDAVSYFHVFIYSLYEQCCCVSLLVP